jgi:hypothetical protein
MQVGTEAPFKPFAAGLAAVASAVALMGMPLQADAVSGVLPAVMVIARHRDSGCHAQPPGHDVMALHCQHNGSVMASVCCISQCHAGIATCRAPPLQAPPPPTPPTPHLPSPHPPTPHTLSHPGGGGISKGLAFEDVSGKDLTKMRLTKVDMRQANFTGSNLAGGWRHGAKGRHQHTLGPGGQQLAAAA